MIKTFIGNAGYYEIEENGSVIQKMVDSFGRFTGKIKRYRNAKYIPNPMDREAVMNILQMLRIYKITA